MDFFLISVLPPIIVLASLAIVFAWGAYGKEKGE